MAEQLFGNLWIKYVLTTARHPRTNRQAEIANKSIAKYLSTYVNETTLNWEQYLLSLMYRDNTSFHWSIQNTPFFPTFGIEPRQLGLPMPEICQKLYG